MKGNPGVYNVMCAYLDEKVGLMAGRLALELVSSLLPVAYRPVEGLDILNPRIRRSETDGNVPGMASLLRIASRRLLGPTTQSLTHEARK